MVLPRVNKRNLLHEHQFAKEANVTTLQVRGAIEQVKAHCKLLEDQENYEAVSVRGILRTLGYGCDQITQVLAYIAEHGFSYCLDHEVLSHWYDGNTKREEYPDWQVCYWDPSQIRSRLNALRS
jgi:hypothetical protein